jgi:predicted nucleic acid-binding protein
VTLYAETSAVLRWLLGQPDAEVVRRHLEGARRVVSSELTIVECERALVRLAGSAAAPAIARARALVAELRARWTLVEIDAPIRARAGQPFPIEPLRALDALHLATALELASTIGPLAILSTDARIAGNARALGFAVVP